MYPSVTDSTDILRHYITIVSQEKTSDNTKIAQLNMTIRNATESDCKSWDNLAGHPLQSWAWGDFRKSMGVTVDRLTVIENSSLTEGWQLTFHPIPYTPFTVGYFPKGPKLNKFMLDQLLVTGRKHKAIYIQLEPNVVSNFKFEISNLKCFLPSHRPLFTKYTFVLDLTKSEEELMKNMHQKTRYNIKVALKHGVSVRQDNSDSAFADYLRLEEETTTRQKFYAHNLTYHRKMWNIMKKSGIAKLWTASYKGEILTAWIIFCWKDTIYYPYGASSRNYREVMAPNLLLWEIAKWGQANGFKKFDLWGSLGPNPDQADPWYGFHRFKAGYNPDLVEYAGSFDLIINPLLYGIYKIADTGRWGILKFCKKISR